MKLKSSLFAAAATLAIAPAAHAYQGLYGAIGAGLSYMQEERDVSNDGTGPNNTGVGAFIFDSAADYDKGIGVYAALGYDWGNNWRTELEFSYRNNDIDQIDRNAGFSGFAPSEISGDSKSYAVLLNALYDFDLGNAFTPYIGGGFGIASINHSIAGASATGAPGTPNLSIAYGNSNDVAVAYQGIAGLAVALAEDLTLDLSYRYFGTSKSEIAGTLNGAPALFDIGYATHNLFAGLRWNFGAAPAAAPAVQYKDCWDGSSVPVTSECPPQMIEEVSEVAIDPINFTVYFDYDKSNLTDQALTLVQEAAGRALANAVDTVVVQGNTDTSGSSAYNQALSERRGRVVRDALIANGVSADDIRVEAFGESNPAKPTPDGVREPLNRRSDVTITFE